MKNFVIFQSSIINKCKTYNQVNPEKVCASTDQSSLTKKIQWPDIIIFLLPYSNLWKSSLKLEYWISIEPTWLHLLLSSEVVFKANPLPLHSTLYQKILYLFYFSLFSDCTFDTLGCHSETKYPPLILILMGFFPTKYLHNQISKTMVIHKCFMAFIKFGLVL